MNDEQEMTERLRRATALDPRISEKRMFGGICFLLDGKILAAARRNGTLLLQVGSAAAEEHVGSEGIAYMEMKGRKARNFIEVELGLIETEDELDGWLQLAERYVVTKEKS
jgi:hypothetical protein